MVGNNPPRGGNNDGNPATHFGRQVRKERKARGWSVQEFGKRSGISPGHVSRIENFIRPPTEAVAAACDAVFPERHGWFTEYYLEMRTWAPPGFRDWPEYEDRATEIREWSPMVVTGMLQTAGYARAMLAVHPGVTREIIEARLASRMERQRRVLLRKDDPPSAVYVIDYAALERLVGSAEIMAGQMRYLATVAAMPNVVLQVLPAVACPATQGGFLLIDDAAFAETPAAGYVYTGEETVTSLARLFDTLRGECMKISESAALLERMAEQWTTGASRSSPEATGATASKLPAATA